jgi:hypothetical protein
MTKRKEVEKVETLEHLSLERVEQIIPAVNEYDADAEQLIPLSITKNKKSFRVIHRLLPLSDERYFALERARREVQKRLIKRGDLGVFSFDPNAELWNDLAIERIGYAPTPDWKAKTYYLDKTSAITALLHAQIIDETDADDADADELLGDDDFEVNLRVLQSGVLIETAHYFREETKAEMDEFLAIMSEKPNPNALASATKREELSERLCALYDAMATGSEGYAGRVPAWHKVTAVSTHLSRQFARLGKSLSD